MTEVIGVISTIAKDGVTGMEIRGSVKKMG